MALLPIGSIIIAPTDAAVPTGWHVCDGSSGTLDLRGVMVPGAGGSYAVGDSGGSAQFVVPSHEHTLGTSSIGGGTFSEHTHTWTFQLDLAAASSPAASGATPAEGSAAHVHAAPAATFGDPGHDHPVSGVYDFGGVTSGFVKLPLTMALHFIQRLS